MPEYKTNGKVNKKERYGCENCRNLVEKRNVLPICINRMVEVEAKTLVAMLVSARKYLPLRL